MNVIGKRGERGVREQKKMHRIGSVSQDREVSLFIVKMKAKCLRDKQCFSCSHNSRDYSNVIEFSLDVSEIAQIAKPVGPLCLHPIIFPHVSHNLLCSLRSVVLVMWHVAIHGHFFPRPF